MRCPRPSSRQGFSLVETRAVVAIITVLAVLSMPSISSLGRSSNLTAGGNALSDLAVMAQQYAMSHNVMTALVCVTNPASLPSAQYRAFIVLASDSTGNNWAPVSKWTFLPASVAMSSAANNTFLSPLASPPQSFPTSLTLNGTIVTSSNFVYQCFFPDGRMDTSAASVVLRIVNAQSAANLSAANPPNYYDLIFNPNTGTVKIDRP
jgi:Tfp pilus assembly protein FimT